MNLCNRYFLLAILLATGNLSAQRFEDILPKEIPQEQGKIIQPQTPAAPSLQKAEEGKQKIVSLTFVDKIDEVTPAVPSNTKGIDISKLDLPATKDLKATMQRYLDKPLSTSTLQNIKATLICYFKDKDYPLVGVLFPAEQDISTGHLQVLVILGKLGKVEAKCAKYFSNCKIAREIKTCPGQWINSTQMQKDLDWINSNSFRTTNLLYKKGADVGQTDVILETEDRRPIRPYIGYENSGYQFAGRSRWFGGVNICEPFLCDQQINAQFTSASNPEKWWSLAGSYILPLPNRQLFKVYGGFINSKPDNDDPLADLTGRSWQVSARYETPFRGWKQWKQNFVYGYDFKRTNNFLNYDQSLVFDQYIDISQFVFGYEGSWGDSWGSANYGVNFFISPGSMGPYNKNKFFQQERNGGSANYFYTKLNFDRVTKFKNNWSWILSTVGQISSGPLMPSEALAIGGYATVRGFEENTIVADNGVIMRNEIRTLPINCVKIARTYGQLQFVLFHDLGWGEEIDPNLTTQESKVLTSLGGGIRYTFGSQFNVRWDYAGQINRLPYRDNNNSRMHLGVVLGY